MLDTKQFEKRANQLFESCRDRWRKKLQKGLPKGVKLDVFPDNILPFSRNKFHEWLWQQMGLQAILCPYCRTPIDILSMQLDHKTPLRRGGGPELDNLQAICKRCNQIKSTLSSEEFRLLVDFMDGPGASFRSRLEGLLISGSVGQMMRHFPKRGPSVNKGSEPVYLSEAEEF